MKQNNRLNQIAENVEAIRELLDEIEEHLGFMPDDKPTHVMQVSVEAAQMHMDWLSDELEPLLPAEDAFAAPDDGGADFREVGSEGKA